MHQAGALQYLLIAGRECALANMCALRDRGGVQRPARLRKHGADTGHCGRVDGHALAVDSHGSTIEISPAITLARTTT